MKNTKFSVGRKEKREREWDYGRIHLLQGNLPDPGIESTSFMHLLHRQVGSLPLEPPGKPIVDISDGSATA